MTGRAAALQGGLAALGLLAAYATWQREPERTTGDVVILEVSKNDLARIACEDEKTSVQLNRVKEDGEPVVWVTVKEKPQAPGAGRNPTEPKQPSPTPKPARELRGQETALKLWDSFTPLRALRGLGVLDAAKLKDLKLDDSKQRLTLIVKGAPREFVVSNPGGVPDYYLRDVKDNRVYLVPRAMISDLMNAQGVLVDRRLHVWKQSDFDRLTMQVGGKRRELVQMERDNAHGGRLVPATQQDKKDDLASNWHDKLWRLYVGEILGKGETPPEGQPTIVVRVEYTDGAKTMGWIELGKTVSATPLTSEPAATAPQPVIYARSEHTAGWVKLGGEAATVANEAEKVASAQP